MKSEFNKELYNEFPRLAYTIEKYNINLDCVRNIIDGLVNANMTFRNYKYSKERIELFIKGYIINPESVMSQVFEYDCKLNDIDLDNIHIKNIGGK